jgi:hypothetical protein
MFSKPAFYSLILCILLFITLSYFDVNVEFIDNIIIWIKEQIELIKEFIGKYIPKIEELLYLF